MLIILIFLYQNQVFMTVLWQSYALKNVWLIIYIFLELRDWDYLAADHFPYVNCILSRRRYVHECNIIVFFQPLQAKQWLTWVGTCETKYCFYLSELAIMDQERNFRTNWDLMPRWYFPRLGLIWANGKKLYCIHLYIFSPYQLFYEGN